MPLAIVELDRIRVDLPQVPNFIRSAEWHDIATFTDVELRAIGDIWVQTLLEQARKRRAQRVSERDDQ